ncbi:MAG: (2Fe-2S)-binding protein [Phycisphaerales bacterium]|nr:(2Fe-2S)-binding protein [Phycisphaerales bacterium]
MPQITIDGKKCDFAPGQMIIQVANANGLTIPQYCYHDALSIVASCRICLAEVWQPNPRNNNALEAIPKLVPTCQTACADGMVVYTDSPKAVANQKAVMEYLLINHPLDCPVCDQSGECFLQDYSYEYGRGQSRFEETKVKNPKKDLGPHVYLYADRCIMCTRCVRFTREATGTAELLVQGRGNKNEIDVFPGIALDNELSANVIDLCPVGALLDKDFLFTQRVWFLKETPSIDGLTASGDNITVHHNDGKVYRFKPRTNMAVNKWWITDEVRYSWKHVHGDQRIAAPVRRQFGVPIESDWMRAYRDAITGIRRAAEKGGRLALVVSPMLSCEDAYWLGRAALKLDPRATLAIGPVPRDGQDRTYPVGAKETDPKAFKVYAEKAPNARGVKRVLEALVQSENTGAAIVAFDAFVTACKSGSVAAAIVAGNYPSDWITDELARAVEGRFIVAIDTLRNRLTAAADIVLPGAVWLEKAGSFENARGLIQAFEQAIPPVGIAKAEGQIGLDLLAILSGIGPPVEPTQTVVMNEDKRGQVPDATRIAAPVGRLFNAADTRGEMAGLSGAMSAFATEVRTPVVEIVQEPDMQVVEL